MKHLRIFVLVMAYGLLPMAHELFAEQITLDLSTATDLNGNPVVYSPSPIANTYYDLTHVWEHTYNDADSCQAILVNGGVFSFSHLPSQSTKSCPHCGSQFLCQPEHPTQCQCSGIVLSAAARIYIAEHYPSQCLCAQCLKEISKL